MKGEPQILDILQTFVQLNATGSATPLAADGAFWRGLSSSDPDSRFVGCVEFKSRRDLHSDAWEMHDRSDEVIVLLEGELDVTLEMKVGDPAADVVKRLEPGQACIVPVGIWHRLTPIAPGKLLFINTRSGTDHREGR